jgi:RecJ-like exonuclease
MEAVIKHIISNAMDTDKVDDEDYIENLRENIFDQQTHHDIAGMITDAQYFGSFKKLWHYWMDIDDGQNMIDDLINAIDNKQELLNLYGVMYIHEHKLFDSVLSEKKTERTRTLKNN